MSIKIIATNRKAFHNFEVGEKVEAGIALRGTEVKVLRQGQCNLQDGWVDFVEGNAVLLDIHIGHYKQGNIFNHEEKRPRQLLLHKREIARLSQAVGEKGMALIPVKIYFKDQRVKVEIALAKGKKQFDKRAAKQKQDANREAARALKSRNTRD